MNQNERISRAIKLSGKRKREIADECGVAPSAITQWINGETKTLKAESAMALAKATGFRAEWIINGTGAERDEKPDAEASNVTPAAQPIRYFRYPVISSVVAGGWGEAIQPYEPGAEDRAELTDYKAKGPAFWLEVEGDSMTSPTPPSIPEGHLILVDTGIEAMPGHLVVAKLEGDEKATFKKLVSDAGQMYLKPLNPAYPIIPINGNCRIIGVVKEAKMKL